jgi:hypothetical protein
MEPLLALGVTGADPLSDHRQQLEARFPTIVLGTDPDAEDRAARADVLVVSDRWLSAVSENLLADLKAQQNPPLTALFVDSDGDVSTPEPVDELLTPPVSFEGLEESVERLADKAAYGRALTDYYHVAATIAREEADDGSGLTATEREKLESQLVALRGTLSERVDRLGIEGYAVTEEGTDAT